MVQEFLFKVTMSTSTLPQNKCNTLSVRINKSASTQIYLIRSFWQSSGFCWVASYSTGIIIKTADLSLFALAPAQTNQSYTVPPDSKTKMFCSLAIWKEGEIFHPLPSKDHLYPVTPVADASVSPQLWRREEDPLRTGEQVSERA